MSVLNSLNMANTDTGSVADIKELNANDSLHEKCGIHPERVRNLIRKPNEIMAMNVPTNANISTVPRFLKKLVFFMLNPDSKMIQGSRIIKKIARKCFWRFSI